MTTSEVGMRETASNTMRRIAAGLLVAALSVTAAAQDAEYGDTYTNEELAALDRALHAGNLDRRDMTFDKALTDGHGSLGVVLRMFADPLTIAQRMDEAARKTDASVSGVFGQIASWQMIHLALWGGPGEHGMTKSPDDLVSALAKLLERQPKLVREGLGEDKQSEADRVLDALRVQLPKAMAWHDVGSSPFEGERHASAEAWGKDRPEALYEAANELPGDPLNAWNRVFTVVEPWVRALPAEAFPTEAPLIVETRYGRIGLGTMRDDVWTGDFAALIDPGGNDRYVGCRLGAAYGTADRRVGFFADLAGDDVYECADVDITLGAAVLGVAAFYDLGAGDDRYSAGHCSLGAAIGGTAVFFDDGGSDVYEGKTFTQGAAGFGVAAFIDESVQPLPETSSDEGTKEPVDIGLFDNDRLSAWANAQAFARPRGIAFCINRRGNEVYQAGGVYLHAPLFADRYQSFSQGFAIGAREVDWAGGIAMLIDHDGNDRYLGDIYNQGVGYWYGAGFLWDGGGNDTYEMTQYGQGSGIHLAVGGLVDVSGNDTYVMHSGLGQGGSHDYAASILHDRGGNDRYHGSTSCNGCGLTNSVGLQIDREGNDTYGARRKSGVNFGRPARGFPSIGVLLDLAGKDDYLGEMADDQVWRHTDIGVGLDVTPEAAEPAAGNTPGADKPTGEAVIPEVCSYEGELTDEVFDELWTISVRWEVGDNRAILPKARARLVQFGAAILPHMDDRVETENSGLELRAFVDVLRGLADGGAADEVAAFVKRNGEADSERRKRVALHLIGELQLGKLEDVVLAILTGENKKLRRRAAAVLPKIASHAGDEVLTKWLSGDDARARATAVATLLALESDVYDALRPHIASHDFAVRGRLVTGLAGKLETYGKAVVADLSTSTDPRRIRSLLDVLARAAKSPPEGALDAVGKLLKHSDAGVRADAARVVRAWQRAEVDVGALATTVNALAATDDDPLVRSFAR